ncbi:hypothetical protein TELCIR_23540, partial [Teladorsagia circumcincta]
IQMVALQWLVANEEAFSPTYIDKNVLERLIRTSARRCSRNQVQARACVDTMISQNPDALSGRGGGLRRTMPNN